MNILKRFGVDNVYTFPTDMQFNYDCDFGKLKSYIAGLPGIHGGISGLGSGRGKAAVGTVQCDILLDFTTTGDATDKIDSLRQMQDWGLQPLAMKPTVGAERFCWARLVDAPLSQDVHNVPSLRQRMTLKFEVPDPFWYTAGVERLWDGTDEEWDSGSWDGSSSAPSPTTVTSEGTVSLTVGGTVHTLARMIIDNNSGANAYDPLIQRIVNGAVVDEVQWRGVIADGESLEIDARRQTVILVGTDAYSSLERPLNPDWMRLYPGTNSLDCYITGAADFSVRWMERYV